MALALISLPFIFDLSRRRREREQRRREGSAQSTDTEDQTIEEQVRVYDEQDRLEEQARERREERRSRRWRHARDTPQRPVLHPIHTRQSGEKTSQSGFLALGDDVDTISPLPSSSPLEKTRGNFPRSVTIESVSQSRHRRRSPSPSTHSPSSTSRSRLSRIKTALLEQWDNRHDPSYSGFWAACWSLISGGKEGNGSAGPRPGDEGYVEPKYRWTPIISGLVVPFSILLEIPGLTEHWYVRTVNGSPVEYQPNPRILDIGLGISMAAALVANLALISRFLERRVWVSTLIAIAALTIHDLINIAAVTTFGVIHRFNDGFTYAEAFWLTVCSSVASVITNLTLIYDLVRTEDFKHSGSGLTTKQRSLVIVVMTLLGYIALGALVYNVMDPTLSFQNALYFTVVSIETIGFGDLFPDTTGSRVFFMFYETFGVINLAVAVATARDTILESWEAAYRKRRRELQRRNRERKRSRGMERARTLAIERRLTAIGVPIYAANKAAPAGGRGGQGVAASHTKHLNIEALTSDQLKAAEEEALGEVNVSSTSRSGETDTDPRSRALEDVRTLQDELATQSVTSEEGYREFTRKIAREERNEKYLKFAFAFSLFVAFWLVGATVFSQCENWSWFIAFYFCYVSFATVGFGDYYPRTGAGRAFFIVWAIFGVATMTLLIAVLSEAYESTYKKAVHQKGIRQTLMTMRENAQRRGSTTLSRTATMSSVASSGMLSFATSSQQDTEGGTSGQATLTEEPQDMTSLQPVAVPYLLLDAAKSFHEHIHHFSQHENSEPTPELRRLLEAMADENNMTTQEKDELMKDAEARRVMFIMSYEKTLQTLISVVEQTVQGTQEVDGQRT